VPSAIDEWNRRADRAAAVFAAAFLRWLLELLTRIRDVVVPQARARQARVMVACRKTALALVPHVGTGALTEEQVINIRALLSAQSIGWYGPIVPAPADISLAKERQEDESDRLAS
jgi:hypothetical protein